MIGIIVDESTGRKISRRSRRVCGTGPPATSESTVVLSNMMDRLLELDFDLLLLAHRLPIVGGGKQALRQFAD